MNIKVKWLAASIVIIMIFIISAFWDFSYKALEYSQEVNEKRLEDSGRHNAYNIKQNLESTLYFIKTSGREYQELDDIYSVANIKKIQDMEINKPLKTIFIANREGLALNSAGVHLDISQKEYFRRAMLGESMISFQKEASSFDQANIIILSAPIVSNGKVIGTIHGEYDLFLLAKLIDTEQFNENNREDYFAIIKGSGEYILGSEIFDSIKKEGAGYNSFFSAPDDIQHDNIGVMYKSLQVQETGKIICEIDGNKWAIFYVPIGINDWYLLKMVDINLIKTQADTIKNIVSILIIKILVVFIFLGLLIHLVIRSVRARQMEESLKFKSLADNIPGGVAEIIVNDGCDIHYASKGFYDLIGYTKEEFMGGVIQGCGLKLLVDEKQEVVIEKFLEAIRRNEVIDIDYQIICHDGSLKWVNCTGNFIKKTREGFLIQAIFTDISLQKARTKEIIEHAKLDKMTQIYDKVSVSEIIAERFKNFNAESRGVLLIIDIDNFKNINDSYGHLVGDKVIIELAKKIKKFFRKNDIVGRAGGDEFIVFMDNVLDADNAVKRVSEFTAYLNEIAVTGLDEKITCSIGGSVVAGIVKTSYKAIFNNSDNNLYKAKKAGKNQSIVNNYQGVD